MSALLIILDEETEKTRITVEQALLEEDCSYRFVYDTDEMVDCLESGEFSVVLIPASILAQQHMTLEYDFLKNAPISKISVLPGSGLDEGLYEDLSLTFGARLLPTL